MKKGQHVGYVEQLGTFVPVEVAPPPPPGPAHTHTRNSFRIARSVAIVRPSSTVTVAAVLVR